MHFLGNTEYQMAIIRTCMCQLYELVLTSWCLMYLVITTWQTERESCATFGFLELVFDKFEFQKHVYSDHVLAISFTAAPFPVSPFTRGHAIEIDATFDEAIPQTQNTHLKMNRRFCESVLRSQISLVLAWHKRRTQAASFHRPRDGIRMEVSTQSSI